MGIVSKPATKRSRKGHAAVYGPDHGHINAACCRCPRCRERRDTREFVALMDAQIAAQLYNDPPEPTHFSGIEAQVRSDAAGQYRIGVDLAKGGDHYTAHSVRVK